MPRVLLLGPARQAAGGVASIDLDAEDASVTEFPTLGVLCAGLIDRFGPAFSEVLAVSRIWIDGEPAESSDRVPAAAEVSILPPVSGG